jgi:heat-inducible transcriptional repressor
MNKRQHEILTCVVDHFIDVHQPISSGKVLDLLAIQISSATVRQVLSVLDNGGYIEKLHTSSGRIPTQKGYRVYVDHLPSGDSPIEINHFVNANSFYLRFHGFFDKFLENLSKKVPYVLLLQLNSNAHLKFASLKYVSISSYYGLILATNEFGFISEYYVRFERDVSMLNKSRLVEWASVELSKKLDITIPSRYSVDEANFLNQVIDALLRPGSDHSMISGGWVKNISRCLNLADYSDKSSIQSLISFLDDSEALMDLMNKNSNSSIINISIGSELSDPRLHQSSVVTVPICIDGRSVATLGILGPSRMDYMSLIKLLTSKETLAELIQV